MSKPIILAIKKALEVAFQKTRDSDTTVIFTEQSERMIRTLFYFQLETVEAALITEKLSRNVAIGELHVAIDKFFENLPELIKTAKPPEMIPVIFKVMVKPLIEHLET